MNEYAYRKKPVEIEAWQWNFSNEQLNPPEWMNAALAIYPRLGGAAFWPDGDPGAMHQNWQNQPHIAIRTLEGTMRAEPGDWIIRGVAGELYPCKPDIFAKTYEKA